MKMKIKWLGSVVVVMFLCSMMAGAALAAAPQKGKAEPQKGKTELLTGKSVNVNTATAEDMIKNVPQMTPELAKNIVQYRKDNGDFQQKEELLQVKGMNRTLLKKWEKFFELEGIGGKDCTC